MSMPHRLKKIQHTFQAMQRCADSVMSASQERALQMNIWVLLTVLVFGVGYLIQINTLATKGYSIRSLEKQITQKQKENERLQAQIIEAQSLTTLQNRIDTLRLVKAHNVEYIESTRPVASR